MTEQKIINTKSLQATLTVTTGKFSKIELTLTGEFDEVSAAPLDALITKAKKLRKDLEAEEDDEK